MTAPVDFFAQTIKDTIDVFGIQQGYGWHSYIQSDPQRREWNDMPYVAICPSGKSRVMFHSFGNKNITSQYQLFLVSDNDMYNLQNNMHNTFGENMVYLFMPMTAGLALKGAWQSRVTVLYDIDRTIFPKTYNVSCAEVQISWIQPY